MVTCLPLSPAMAIHKPPANRVQCRRLQHERSEPTPMPVWRREGESNGPPNDRLQEGSHFNRGLFNRRTAAGEGGKRAACSTRQEPLLLVHNLAGGW